MSCPICAVNTRAGQHVVCNPSEVFLEGALLGIMLERMSANTGTNVSTKFCASCLARMRELVKLIPSGTIDPSYRHLLNFGLVVIKGGKRKVE